MITQCTLSADILQCSDTKCTCKSHCLGIEVFCDAIISTCIDVGNTCIPKCKRVGRSRPEWNAEVKALRVDSLFWHRLWVDMGRPQGGAVAGVLRNTRYKYYKVVKTIKTNQFNIRKAKLAEKAHELPGR